MAEIEKNIIDLLAMNRSDVIDFEPVIRDMILAPQRISDFDKIWVGLLIPWEQQ